MKFESKKAKIDVKINQETKEKWKMFCRTHGQTETAMLNKILNKILPEEIETIDDSVRGGKVTVRLPIEAVQTGKERAVAEGYKWTSTWFANLILANLFEEPVLTDEEIFVLRESNRGLKAIGRNLNQIAKALNINIKNSEFVGLSDVLQKLSKQLDVHFEKNSALLVRNMSRWRANDPDE